jgi:hypothetical protein
MSFVIIGAFRFVVMAGVHVFVVTLMNRLLLLMIMLVLGLGCRAQRASEKQYRC